MAELLEVLTSAVSSRWVVIISYSRKLPILHKIPMLPMLPYSPSFPCPSLTGHRRVRGREGGRDVKGGGLGSMLPNQLSLGSRTHAVAECVQSVKETGHIKQGYHHIAPAHTT